MSNKANHRRGEPRRTETGPRYESRNPGKGCNATHVAAGRRKYKRRRARHERRAAGTRLGAAAAQCPNCGGTGQVWMDTAYARVPIMECYCKTRGDA